MLLTVHTPKSGTHLLTIAWSDGVAEVLFVKEELRSSVAGWLARGLHEWVGAVPGPGKAFRRTRSSDPDFVPRLADYLLRQFPTILIELSVPGAA